MSTNIQSFMRSIAHSDLIRWSFDLRNAGLNGTQSSELVELLIERFLLERCGFLASAAARLIGSDHYLGWYHPDGRLAHSVVMVEPFALGSLEGDGIDILGKRPLQQIDADIRLLAPDVYCRIGEIFHREDFETGEEAELQILMSALPWYRTKLNLEPISPEILATLFFPHPDAPVV